MARGWGGQVIVAGVLGNARASVRECAAQRVEPTTEINRGGYDDGRDDRQVGHGVAARLPRLP
jgi:hypothetical protein